MDSNIRILLVDDDQFNHQFFQLVIQELKCEVTSSYSGTDAMKLLERASFDLVVSDLNMDQGDGYWLSQKIKTEFKNTPLIIWSGESDFQLKDDRLKHALAVVSTSDTQHRLKPILTEFIKKMVKTAS